MLISIFNLFFAKKILFKSFYFYFLIFCSLGFYFFSLSLSYSQTPLLTNTENDWYSCTSFINPSNGSYICTFNQKSTIDDKGRNFSLFTNKSTISFKQFTKDIETFPITYDRFLINRLDLTRHSNPKSELKIEAVPINKIILGKNSNFIHFTSPLINDDILKDFYKDVKPSAKLQSIESYQYTESKKFFSPSKILFSNFVKDMDIGGYLSDVVIKGNKDIPIDIIFERVKGFLPSGLDHHINTLSVLNGSAMSFSGRHLRYVKNFVIDRDSSLDFSDSGANLFAINTDNFLHGGVISLLNDSYEDDLEISPGVTSYNMGRSIFYGGEGSKILIDVTMKDVNDVTMEDANDVTMKDADADRISIKMPMVTDNTDYNGLPDFAPHNFFNGYAKVGILAKNLSEEDSFDIGLKKVFFASSQPHSRNNSFPIDHFYLAGKDVLPNSSPFRDYNFISDEDYMIYAERELYNIRHYIVSRRCFGTNNDDNLTCGLSPFQKEEDVYLRNGNDIAIFFGKNDEAGKNPQNPWGIRNLYTGGSGTKEITLSRVPIKDVLIESKQAKITFFNVSDLSSIKAGTLLSPEDTEKDSHKIYFQGSKNIFETAAVQIWGNSGIPMNIVYDGFKGYLSGRTYSVNEVSVTGGSKVYIKKPYK